MKKHRFFKVVIVVLAIAFLGGVTSAVGQPKGEPIKIGLLFPRSGPLAKIGQEEIKSVQLAVKELNEKGGILIGDKRVSLKRPIKLIDYDSKDVDTALGQVEKLANIDNVDIIIGGTSSTLVYAESAKAASVNKPLFAVNAASPKITERGLRNTWRVATTSNEYGEAIALLIKMSAPYLHKKPEELKVAIVYEDGVFGVSGAEASVEYLGKMKIPVVLKIPYDKETKDFTPVIVKLREAKVDVTNEISYVADAILLRQQSKALNFYVPVVVGGANGHASLEYRDALGKDSIGVMTPMDSTINANPQKAPGVRHFARRWKQEFGEEVWAPYCIIGYETMQVITLILKEIEAKGLPINVETIEQIGLSLDIPDYSLVTGHGVKFDRKTHQNLRNFAFGIQWQPNLMKESVWFEGKADGAPSMFTVYPQAMQMKGAEFGYLPLAKW